MAHFEVIRNGSKGVSLYLQGWESAVPAKAVVCLVHGLGEHSGRYAHLAEVLNRAGYHVIALDLRGHGKTAGKRGALPRYDLLGKDVSLLLAETASRYPALPQILYGHSLGAIVVLYFCLRFKPRLQGVVATSPGLMNALEEQKGMVLMVKLLGALLPEVVIASELNVADISRDPAVVERYLSDTLVHDRASLGWAKDSFRVIGYIYENAKNWELPLLLMHGMDDKIAYARGSQKFADLVPSGRCTLRLWQGCAHELHNEPEKEEVYAYLIQHLDGFLAEAA